MAKGKNLNPADAHRKAQRKKELKKNKVERQKIRDFGLVKKDTSELEHEISELESLGDGLKSAQKHRLSELKAELKRIMDKKEEYIAEHPEQRHLVYKRRRDAENDEDDEKKDNAPPLKTRRLFYDRGPKKGLPRHPERSVYYDPVMNPHGMPPPGMPYAERPLLPGEIDSDAEPEVDESEDSDDDIPMPAGPPPGATTTEDDSEDDDIPLPPGPPPSAQASGSNFVPPLPPGPPPPFSTNQNMPLPTQQFPPIPPPGFSPSLPPPPPPPLFAPQGAPNWLPPPPPPPMTHMSYGAPPPPPPPGFFPRNKGPKNSSVIQDPLSDAPHLTFQERREIRQAGGSLPTHPSLPARPITAAPASSSSQTPSTRATSSTNVNATISAEPELRDFKKESTAFIPAALRRKKAKTVNAAPAVTSKDGADTEQAGVDVEAKPDLLGTLREKLGPMMPMGREISDDTASKRRRLDDSKALESKQKQGTDDYENFLAEMGDLLNAPQS